MSNKPVYELKDGNIFRKGEAVGFYDLTTGEILEINSTVPKQMVSVLRRMISEEHSLPPGKTLVEVFSQENAAGVVSRSLDAPFAKVEANLNPHAAEIPEEPKQGPQGDKTPEWAYWLRVYHPDKFAKRFAGRRVMGVLIPPNEKTAMPDLPVPPPAAPQGDIPESSMAKEAEEVWVRGSK